MTKSRRPGVAARLAAHARVEHCDDERDCGNGVLITLRQGWTWDAIQDNRVQGFNTLSDALRAVQREAKPFHGAVTK